MFGSLVVFYPTSYQGGALVFRHDDKEYSFDASAAMTENDGPCVASATFFSDLDHEVAVVNSGYRLTITYNLFFDLDNPFQSTDPDTTVLSVAFRELLN